ncbi:hypothetical protein B0H11DRAFT_1927466 [Mycena galericulata]|nr:hypothetical protein B0H11DRAFT_1927466 [Mycena galericulata]
MTSEQEPLLPSSVPRPTDTPPFRERTAEFLESQPLHNCVLADLGYTFLHDGCTPGEDPAWLEVLAHISLAITSFFLVEIPLALYSLGPRFYNPFGSVPHAGLHLFDAFIIITTFVLEVLLRGKEQELAGLLVILRLWRLVKLVGDPGVSVGVGEIDEADAIRASEAEEELAAVKKENADLRARLEAAGLQ